MKKSIGIHYLRQNCGDGGINKVLRYGGVHWAARKMGGGGMHFAAGGCRFGTPPW